MVSYWRKIHPPAITAQEVAQADHVPGREVAKTVVLKADDRMILAVLRADQVIRFDRLQTAIGSRTLRLALESEFVNNFPGCERGAMPPFGKLFRMPVYCDRALAGQSEIEFNCGTHKDAIRMCFSEFDLLERPVLLDFAETMPAIRMIRWSPKEAVCK